jgi:hypothetical protein
MQRAGVAPAFFFWWAARAVAVAALLAAVACAPRFDWRELKPPAQGYVVALPGKPQQVSRQIAFEHPGGAVQAEMTMLSTGLGASLFAVGSVRLPAHAIDTPAALGATLAWFADGLLRNVQAVSATLAEAPPVPGASTRTVRAARAFAVPGKANDGRPATLAVRLYVVDDRLFQLVALGAEGEIPPAALDTFFDSFRLTP